MMFITDTAEKRYLRRIASAIYTLIESTRAFRLELRKPDGEYSHVMAEMYRHSSNRAFSVLASFQTLMDDDMDVLSIVRAGLKHGFTVNETLDKYVHCHAREFRDVDPKYYLNWNEEA